MTKRLQSLFNIRRQPSLFATVLHPTSFPSLNFVTMGETLPLVIVEWTFSLPTHNPNIGLCARPETRYPTGYTLVHVAGAEQLVKRAMTGDSKIGIWDLYAH